MVNLSPSSSVFVDDGRIVSHSSWIFRLCMKATLHQSGNPASLMVFPANLTFSLIGKQIPITSGTLD